MAAERQGPGTGAGAATAATGSAGGTGVLPEHVTMPLLTRITQSSLDQDYQVVAEQRRARARSEDGDGPAHLRSRPTRTTAAICVVFGLLVVMAAVQTSRNSSIDATGRATLTSQIMENRDSLSRLQSRAVDLRAQISDLEEDLEELAATERTERNRLRRLRLRTGYLAVSGPGVRIEVDDAPDGELVRDEDLTILVNGLWRAGAEAIAVNDQRLTVVSAFSHRGPAILLNSRPLNPPYLIQAVGDPNTLQANFANTTSGLSWIRLQQGLGFDYSIRNDDDLSLPAARPSTLRSAVEGVSTDRDPTKEEVAS